ncbi:MULTISPECIES: hypothetical protein [unclassified Aeromicrobium]|uniref:hypothetical protein n=1 Tax=unclassified Aeromicrobium TaxID=2633570 RepID=UPI00257D7963|nr:MULTISPECIES: hypothetical protein [unclassified Aeromicrobium]
MTHSPDIVGRFRSGYQANDRPVALQNWRITSGDPEVADKVADQFGAPSLAAVEVLIEGVSEANEITLRLAEEPALGVFAWRPPSGLADEAARLARMRRGRPARLSLEPASYVAANGPRAGQTIRYTRPSLSADED